jgi:hypothetical protein
MNCDPKSSWWGLPQTSLPAGRQRRTDLPPRPDRRGFSLRPADLPASGSDLLKVTTEVSPEHEGNTERDRRNTESALDLLIPALRAFRRDN